MRFMHFKNSLLILTFILMTGVFSFSQDLFIYVVPPPAEISWNSPRDLMRTTVVNQVKQSMGLSSYALGHIYVGLEHEEKGEQMWTGMTRDENNTASRKVLREGYGMGILFADIKGRLQETEEVVNSIREIEESGESTYLRFSLSEENYQRLKSYFIEYDERGYGSVYNGLNRPREGLGAGCAAFGESFLELAGIPYRQWVSDWSAEILVPERLAGGTLFDRHVTILRQLLSSRWAKEDEPHYYFFVIDPFYVHNWILEKWDNQPTDPIMQLEKRNGVQGIFMDFTHLKPPEEPIFIFR